MTLIDLAEWRELVVMAVDHHDTPPASSAPPIPRTVSPRHGLHRIEIRELSPLPANRMATNAELSMIKSAAPFRRHTSSYGPLAGGGLSSETRAKRSVDVDCIDLVPTPAASTFCLRDAPAAAHR